MRSEGFGGRARERLNPGFGESRIRVADGIRTRDIQIHNLAP